MAWECLGWRPSSVQRGRWYESIHTSPSAPPLPREGLPRLTQDCTALGFYSKRERAHCSNAVSVNPTACSPGTPDHARAFLSSLIISPRLPLNSSSALEPDDLFKTQIYVIRLSYCVLQASRINPELLSKDSKAL